MSYLRKACWNAFTLWNARHERSLPYWPLERLLELQNRRVQAIVAHAYATVPYYRETMDAAGLRPADFRCADDLAELPIVTSQQVAREGARFRSSSYPDSVCLHTNSSGTSGERKDIYYDPAAAFLSLAHSLRQRMVARSLVGARRPSGRGREMTTMSGEGTSSHVRSFYEAHYWVPKRFEIERRRLDFRAPLEENIIALNAFQPNVLWGMGSFLGALYRYAHQQKLNIWRPALIWYGADHMPAADQEVIESHFGVPVYSSYQASEAFRIAYQCERRDVFHICFDDVAVRVVDDAGRMLPAGERGHILISNLTNRAMVLLNYALGDIVTLSTAPCRCGRTLPAIKRIEGRSDDLVVMPGGRLLLSPFLLRRLAVPGVVQTQLVQEELDRFLVRTVYTGTENFEAVAVEVASRLRDALQRDQIAVQVERCEVLPASTDGKVRAVISHCRDLAGTTGPGA